MPTVSSSSTSARPTSPRRPRSAATCASSSATRASSTSTRSGVRCCSHLVILPRRPAKRAPTPTVRSGTPSAARRCSTTRRTSRPAVAEKLGDGWRVELAMRYGSPSIPEARSTRSSARGVDRIVVLPLFPQYASSSTGTARRPGDGARGASGGTCRRSTSCRRSTTTPASSTAFERVAAPVLAEARPDHVLFSFHGLPVRQIVKTDATGAHCFRERDLLRRRSTNPHCYRAQCFATARALAAPAGPRARPLHRLLPVAARPHAVDRAVHRRRARPRSRSRARSGSR